MIKRIGIFFICVIVMNAASPPRRAYANNSALQNDGALFGLDISSGAVNGDRCEYTMEIPDDWRGYISVEREGLPPGSKTVEQLNIYFYQRNYGFIFLANIFIFQTRYSSEIGSYKRILETDEYDFRIYVSAAEPELTNAGEKIMYNHIVGRLGDVNFVAELFDFPEGKGPVVKERLHVNGKLTGGSVIFKSSQPYVPLRAACEALGYSVIWYGADASVYIERQGTDFTLHTAGNKNYGAVRVENSFYVPALFFIQVLKINFETDKRGNVFITERD